MLREKTVDIKENKDLYGNLMIQAKSSRGINKQEAIGNCEFTLIPRAFFNYMVQSCDTWTNLR